MTGTNAIALTFDDGPCEPFTRSVLEILARNEIKATFFLVGKHCRRFPEIVREIAAQGHEIGNHSHSHSLLSTLDPACRDIQLGQRTIEEITRVRPSLYRPPYGIMTPWQSRRIGEMGMSSVRWSMNSADYRTRDPQTLIRRVAGAVRPGDVVLLHDGRATGSGKDRIVTVLALPEIIRRLRERGFSFVPLSALLKGTPGSPTNDRRTGGGEGAP